MIQLYTIYKRLISIQKTQIGWKWKDEKRYFSQIVTERDLGWLYYIRQNKHSIKKVYRDKEGLYILKGIIQQEDITVVNIYVPNDRP